MTRFILVQPVVSVEWLFLSLLICCLCCLSPSPSSLIYLNWWSSAARQFYHFCSASLMWETGQEMDGFDGSHMMCFLELNSGYWLSYFWSLPYLDCMMCCVRESCLRAVSSAIAMIMGVSLYLIEVPANFWGFHTSHLFPFKVEGWSASMIWVCEGWTEDI